jgi:hypothetical protein
MRSGGILLDGARSCTSLVFPLRHDTFQASYRAFPTKTSLLLQGTLTVLRAGAYVELHGGRFGGPMMGDDLAQTERWMTTARQAGYSHGQWTKLLATASAAIQTWYRHEAVQRAIAEIAQALRHRSGHVSHHILHDLMEASSVSFYVPAPQFAPVLAEDRYLPGKPRVALSSRERPAPAPAAPGTARGARRRCCATMDRPDWAHDSSCQQASKPASQHTTAQARYPLIYCVRDQEERRGFCADHEDDDECDEVED